MGIRMFHRFTREMREENSVTSRLAEKALTDSVDGVACGR